MTNIVNVDFSRKNKTVIGIDPSDGNDKTFVVLLNKGLNFGSIVVDVITPVSASCDKIMELFQSKFIRDTECTVFEPEIHNTYPNDIPQFPGLKYIKLLTPCIPMGIKI